MRDGSVAHAIEKNRRVLLNKPTHIMRFKKQTVSSVWSALAHVLLFHQERHISARHEQRALAKRVQERVTHYLCDWDRERYRATFPAGEGGAPTIDAYCAHLKMQQASHPLKSNMTPELRAFSETHGLDVIMYDASTHRPDWKQLPARMHAHPTRASPTVRILRTKSGEWMALYATHEIGGGGRRAKKVAGKRRAPPRAGPYGSCAKDPQCEDDWTCMRKMCVPFKRSLHPPPAPPPL